ncbi:MAG: right-handed parallel beta-helix repeat-containing protein [Planctomycetota bacterium]
MVNAQDGLKKGLSDGDAIQAALNYGHRTVTVPYKGSPWIVHKPINIPSNRNITFGPGVVVMAKEGCFKGVFDCLFEAYKQKNIKIRGYGATLCMRKADYRPPAYPASEHRHVLNIRVCENVKVYGLRLADSGGDGIFIGADREHLAPCKNITVTDCVCDNNYRQGISVTSVIRLRINNCILSNTSGTSPRAGIDLEPDDAVDHMSNIVISNCVSEANGGSGFLVSIGALSDRSAAVSILFKDCLVRNGRAQGLRFRDASKYQTTDPKGLVEFRNCTCENLLYPGLSGVWAKQSSLLKFKFSKCTWQNVSSNGLNSPIYLELQKQPALARTGGVEFYKCALHDNIDRPPLYIVDIGGYPLGVYNIWGAVGL